MLFSFYKYGTLPLKKNTFPENSPRFGVMLPAGRRIPFADMFTGIRRKIAPRIVKIHFDTFLNVALSEL